MDSLDDLASAANAARSSTRRLPAPRGSSAPIVFAILLGSLVIGGAIVFMSLRQGGTASASASGTGVPQQSTGGPSLAEQVRVQTAAFQGFVMRLPDAMARRRKAALQADNTGADTVVTYTCDYTFDRMGTLNAPDGRPTTFTAKFNGSIEGKGSSYHSTDTVAITTAFTQGPDGRWKIASASEQTLLHKTSADLFGVPEKLGQKRDIAQIDWFNLAVNDAQKPQPVAK